MFHFKHFSLKQADSAMKVGTDAMILGAMIDSSNKNQGLDIGSGTGVLSLMVAQQNSLIRIDAVEIDVLSANECEINFANSPWADRLSVEYADFQLFDTNKQYDLIFSNPPYYATTNLNEDVRKANARHEESLPAKSILARVNDFLSIDGEFWVIIPASERERWILLAEQNELFLAESIAIRGKSNKEVNRCILHFGRKKSSGKIREFVVRGANNSYSEEYIQLTKEFHATDLRE